MKWAFDTKTIVRLFNVADLLGIILTLIMTFLIQFILHELPCPLCILQRVGFICMAFGFLLNLRFGFQPSHYAITILSALFTSFIALRQVALHVVPGTGSYGSPLFGLHLYTWSFITSMFIAIVATLLLSIDRQYGHNAPPEIQFPKTTHTFFAVTVLLIVANIISVLFICGINDCPDDPIQYKLLDNRSSL